MPKYEDIQKANASIQTTDIKGKNYAEVNQRIKAFRMVYPTGFIISEMVQNDGGVCVFKSSVGYYDEKGEGVILGTGSAYEKEGSTFINKTSYIENCETSAVGRALGMAGFGIDTSVASAEEVENAMLNQKDNEKISAASARALRKRCENENIDLGKLCELCHVNAVGDLTNKQYSGLINNWEKVRARV